MVQQSTLKRNLPQEKSTYHGPAYAKISQKCTTVYQEVFFWFSSSVTNTAPCMMITKLLISILTPVPLL